jgi:hypothetical protein
VSAIIASSTRFTTPFRSMSSFASAIAARSIDSD